MKYKMTEKTCTTYDPTCKGCIQMHFAEGKWYAARLAPEAISASCEIQAIHGYGVRAYPDAIVTARSLSVMHSLPVVGLKACGMMK